MLKYSGDLVLKLQDESGQECKFCVLADTSYGECCVDDVAASHVSTDLIVHFGNSCLSTSSNFDLYFVFDSCSFLWCAFVEQVERLFRSTEFSSSQRTFIIADVEYYDFLQQNISALMELASSCKILATMGKIAKFCTKTSKNENVCQTRKIFGFDIENVGDEEFNSFNLLFIGKKTSKMLYNIMLESAGSSAFRLYVYNVESQSLITDASASILNTSRAFGKRLRLIEKVSKCQVFGVLVGTFSIANCREAIEGVKKTLKESQKRFFTFVVGKVNVAKLANFLDVEMFVWVGCPSSDLVTNDQCYGQFHAPIITPLELVLGLSEDPFKYSYSNSLERFNEVVNCQETLCATADVENDESCLFKDTLQLKPASNGQLNTECGSGISFGQMLSQKAYRGVPFEKEDISLGSHLSYEIEEGMSGIASEYTDEQKYKHLFKSR